MKEDMHELCGFKLEDMWRKVYLNEISVEEFETWYMNNCGKCVYEYYFCMYGEEKKNG